jgi:hypothetical protein
MALDGLGHIAQDRQAVNRLQESLEGEAQNASFEDERELQGCARSIRKELWDKEHARKS